MVEGYWTALCCIMLLIMIVTGWSRWIDQYVKLVILIPIIVLIWLGQILHWNIDISFSNSMLTMSGSFIAISLLQLASLLLSTEAQFKLIALYSVVLALSLTMLRAFSVISPWAGANITIVNLALASGILLVMLQLNYSTYAAILYWGAALAEPLLMWQQKGDYAGTIGSLLWWDYVSLSLLATVVIKTTWTLVIKITLNFVHSFGKRMKS